MSYAVEETHPVARLQLSDLADVLPLGIASVLPAMVPVGKDPDRDWRHVDVLSGHAIHAETILVRRKTLCQLLLVGCLFDVPVVLL